MGLLALLFVFLGQVAQPCVMPDGKPLFPPLPPWMLDKDTYGKLEILALGEEQESRAADAALRAIPEYVALEKGLLQADEDEGPADRTFASLVFRLYFNAVRNPYDDKPGYGILHELLKGANPCGFASLVQDIPEAIPNLVHALRMKPPPGEPLIAVRPPSGFSNCLGRTLPRPRSPSPRSFRTTVLVVAGSVQRVLSRR